MGLGFRGMSPPWPYVGLGRGGLPRCGYFFSGAATPANWYPQTMPYYQTPTASPGYAPYYPPMTPEEELNSLKSEAEVIKDHLEEIESRMRDLAAKEAKKQ